MSAVVVREDLLTKVKEVENVFIPMSDGVELAARLFLPVDERPAPLIIEYIPYRKRDFMRLRDEPMHRYFAAHGYAVARIDVRGTGDSGGVLSDEYSQQEIDDGLQAIEWLAAQTWCDGNVGMMGISWGGFNALQIAAKRPPALRAIMTLCASDDRYADDAHFMGGCLLNENQQWGSILMLYAAMPPDPLLVGERWQQMWKERIEATLPFPLRWASHTTRDAFWQHGSVCEDYAAIEVPVYAVGGWADGYSNAVGRLLAGLQSPKKGLIGPWAHAFPHRGRPGPNIGFLQEALRWWDHWLRDEPTDVMDEPMLRVWMQESVAPAPHYEQRPGRWVAESIWPRANAPELRFFMNRRTLDPEPTPSSTPIKVSSPQFTGEVAGEWCGFGAPGEMPLDQRPDDGRSLTFDSAPLEKPLEILGTPLVDLELAVDSEVGLVAVRLCEVAPSGTSTRVSYGLLNLTHRHGHETPTPLVPGERTRVQVRLNDIAHRFSPGNRLRVAVSTTYWPLAWPAATPTVLQLWPGSCELRLPTREPHEQDGELKTFEAPEQAPGGSQEPHRPLPFRRTVQRDLVTNALIYQLESDGGEFGNHSYATIEEIDLTMGYGVCKTHHIEPRNPLSALTRLTQWVELKRAGWHIRIECETLFTSDREAFLFSADLRAFLDGEPFASRSWNERAERGLT